MIDYLFMENDIDAVYKLFGRYSGEVGFVLKPTIRERSRNKECIIYKENGVVLGACSFHKRRDGFTTIYEIVVAEEGRGKGIGKEMIKFLIQKRHNIVLKCPVDNKSNNFYQHIGATLLGVVKGKKRDLNIYHLNAMNLKCLR